MKNILFAAFVLIALNSCGHKTGSAKVTDAVVFSPPVVKGDVEEKAMAPGAPNADVSVDAPVGNSDDKTTEYDANSNTGHTVADTSKKIVKEGDIEFETTDLDATRKKIIGALKKAGGYTANDNETTDDETHQRKYELVIRVPAKNFDPLLDSISLNAEKIDSKDIKVTDVTAQYIDIKTRLDNKKILEKRYLELLSKSSKISDLLEIENKLTEIRSDIESTQGQLNYLSKQVAYSSLDITFYTNLPAQVNTGDGFAYKFKTAIADGWQVLQNLFFGLIGLWPVILLITILILVIKRWQKRRRAKKQAL